MKKITFKPRENKHDNDCWCDAIALATNKQYDTIYKKFKEFKEPNGGLDGRFIGGYLDINGYKQFALDVTLYQALQMYDSSEGIVLSLNHEEGSHVIYVKDKVVHDTVRTVDQSNYLVNYDCDKIYIKLDDEFKLIGGSK